MMGVFVQMNTDPHHCRAFPVGYVIQENGCWDWVGNTTRLGYGMFWKNGKYRSAYRVVYEDRKGPIPTGLSLDHLCRNPACVNPDHLEPVSHRTNCLRGVGVSAINVAKTHCKRGHPFDEANTYRRGSVRQCRKRHTLRHQALRARLTANESTPEETGR